MFDGQKCVIVVSDSLPMGMAVNAASVIALTVGKMINGIIGPDIVDGSGFRHVGITTVPIPVLKASAAALFDIRERAMGDGLFVVDFSDAAQQTRNYTDYTTLLGERQADQLTYLALGLVGAKKFVSKLTGSLALVR